MNPQSVGINVQSPQSESTPRRLTLGNGHCIDAMMERQKMDMISKNNKTSQIYQF